MLLGTSLLEQRKHQLKHSSGKRGAQLCFMIPFLQVVQEAMLPTDMLIHPLPDLLNVCYETEITPDVQDGLLLLCKALCSKGFLQIQVR